MESALNVSQGINAPGWFKKREREREPNVAAEI